MPRFHCWNVTFALGGLRLRLRPSRVAAGGPEVPSACCWRLSWRLVTFSPQSSRVRYTLCKQRQRLFELLWSMPMKWRDCRNFKLAFSSWNPWSSLCQIDAPSHNWSPHGHSSVVQWSSCWFFPGQLYPLYVVHYFWRKWWNSHAPNYIIMDYFAWEGPQLL